MFRSVPLSCSIPERFLQLSHSLQERMERLSLLLADQIETLPLGNEAWMQTERELVAAEKALQKLAKFV